MILLGGEKSEQVYDGEDRVYMIYYGEDLVYNCFAIPSDETIYLRADGKEEYRIFMDSNTEWKLGEGAVGIKDFIIEESLLDGNDVLSN